MDRPETERSWAPSHDTSRNAYSDQHRDSRPMEHSQDGSYSSTGPQTQMSGLDLPNGLERSSTTEITKAGVHVDPKKRKRVSSVDELTSLR